MYHSGWEKAPSDLEISWVRLFIFWVVVKIDVETKICRVNSRLSFLRYGPGHYFKPHCDGLNDICVNGIQQKSFVTLHLYLNDVESDGLEGGATRFWSPDKKHWLDVHPKLGRVLVFQQRMLIHSGEEVTKGVKYTMRGDFMFKQVEG